MSSSAHATAPRDYKETLRPRLRADALPSILSPTRTPCFIETTLLDSNKIIFECYTWLCCCIMSVAVFGLPQRCLLISIVTHRTFLGYLGRIYCIHFDSAIYLLYKYLRVKQASVLRGSKSSSKISKLIHSPNLQQNLR